MSVNSRLKAIQIIGHRKTFYSQRITDSTHAIDILVTFRNNGNRKIMQSIKITSRSPSGIRKSN